MDTEDISINETDLDLADLANDSDDEIQRTPAEIIELVEEAWINEKFAPEILPHRSEVVECLLRQITCMEENIQTLSSTDFTKSVYQMEVDRLRFLVSSYLRTRLEKIEMYYLHILREEEQRMEKNEELYLTDNELTFAKEYAESLSQYFEKILNIHPLVSTEEWKNHPVQPNIHSFVFLKSKAEIKGVKIEGEDDNREDVADFKKGSQSIISYNSIASLVKNGDIQLI